MKDWKNLASIIGVMLLVVAGGILIFGLIEDKQGRGGDAPWPNSGFDVPGKDAFLWKFPLDGKLKYVFKGRERGLGMPPSLYDPAGWDFILQGDREDRATVQFIDSRIKIIDGEMRPDGFIRVGSYKDYAQDPLEYWQILLNALFITPRKDITAGEIRTEEVELPCHSDHQVKGKATFIGLGTGRLEGVPHELDRIRIQIELVIMNKEKGDRITEMMAEGLLYWDKTRQSVVAGDWEYANGLPEERYFAPWNYVNFTLEGQDLPPIESDLQTLGLNWVYVLREDITEKERVMRSLQKNARDQLATIAKAQDVFRSLALVDQDRDGKGEFGLLTEVTGASMLLRTPEGSGPGPQPRPSIPIRQPYGNVNAQGFSTVDDFHFQIFLATADGFVTDGAAPVPGDPKNADIQESDGGWCGYSWPVEYGRTGAAVYFTNGKDRLWESRDFILDGGRKVPSPGTTELPSEGTWKRVSITDAVETRPYKFYMVKGEMPDEKTQEMVLDIQYYRIQLDQLGYSKALGEHHFRAMEKTGRDFARYRVDGVLTETEARDIRDSYEVLFRMVYMDSALSALSQAEANVKEGAVPDPEGKLLAEIETCRRLAEAIKEKHADSNTVVDLWERCQASLKAATPMPGR